MQTPDVVDVLISEVGPRDGLQAVAAVMCTEDKRRWISALHAAGLHEIEVASFVPPKLLPQMADAPEVVAHALTLPGLHVLALVPNLRGALAAFECGVHAVTVPISASEAHSLSNVRKTRAQAVDELRAIVALRDERFAGVKIEAGVSTAFGCTIQGTVPEDDVLRLSVQLAEAGVDEIGLSDTTGYANPAQVKRLFTRVRGELGAARVKSVHLHNTRGLGLANALAAYEAGASTFDASQGGLGGCPFAPGASGNIVTEDLVFMFEAMGVRTGVDIERLLAAREALRSALPDEALYGMLPAAGLTKGFVPAAEAAR